MTPDGGGAAGSARNHDVFKGMNEAEFVQSSPQASAGAGHG